MQTLHRTEEKIKVLTVSLFFPVVKQGFLHAVYSLGYLTFHKHFSLRNYLNFVFTISECFLNSINFIELRNYTKHVWIIPLYGKLLQFL